MMSIFMVLGGLVLILLLRLVYVLRQIRRRTQTVQRPVRRSPISTLVVLGSGGHTTEMLELLQELDPKLYRPLTFVVATTDTTSLPRVAAHPSKCSPDKVLRIPRSREVGQSYVTSVATTLWSLVYGIGLVFQARPGLLLCNGPGTCLPIAVWTFVGRVLGLWEGQIVFVESFCRVTSLSLTGKLLYPIVDLFVVHWEQLQAKYPTSNLITTLVPRAKNAK